MLEGLRGRGGHSDEGVLNWDGGVDIPPLECDEREALLKERETVGVTASFVEGTKVVGSGSLLGV